MGVPSPALEELPDQGFVIHTDVEDCFNVSEVGVRMATAFLRITDSLGDCVLRERSTKEKHSAQLFTFVPEEVSHGLSPFEGQELECFAP